MFLYPVFGEVYKIVTWITPAGYRPVADVGEPYSQQLEATSKVGPVTYSVISGTPPAGLSVSSDGLLSGTPTELSNQLFTVRASVITDPTVYADRQFGLATRELPGFVVLANSLIYRSNDMTTWSSVPYPAAAAAAGFRDIVYGNNIYVANWSSTQADPEGHLASLWASEDGATWVKTLGGPVFLGFNNIMFGNGLFMATTSGSVETSGAWTSPDGLTWTQVSSARVTSPGACGKGVFLSVYDKSILSSHDNGATWTVRHTSTSTSLNPWLKMTYSPTLGLFIAIDLTNYIFSSPDGVTWTRTVSVQSSGIAGVGAGGNMLYYSTSTNLHRYTYDGTTWTYSPTNTLFYFVDIADQAEPTTHLYGCGGGSDARVHMTMDGVTFTSSPKLGTSSTLKKIATSRS